MGSCENYGAFLGYPKYQVPYDNRDPKRDHEFDNHPYRDNGKENGKYCSVIEYILGL